LTNEQKGEGWETKGLREKAKKPRTAGNRAFHKGAKGGGLKINQKKLARRKNGREGLGWGEKKGNTH